MGGSIATTRVPAPAPAGCGGARMPDAAAGIAGVVAPAAVPRAARQAPLRATPAAAAVSGAAVQGAAAPREGAARGASAAREATPAPKRQEERRKKPHAPRGHDGKRHTSAPPRWGEEEEGTVHHSAPRGYLTREEKRRGDALLASLHIAFIPETPAVPELLPDPPQKPLHRAAAVSPAAHLPHPVREKRGAPHETSRTRTASVPDGILRAAPMLPRVSPRSRAAHSVRVRKRAAAGAAEKHTWDELWVEAPSPTTAPLTGVVAAAVMMVAIAAAVAAALFWGRTVLVQENGGDHAAAGAASVRMFR